MLVYLSHLYKNCHLVRQHGHIWGGCIATIYHSDRIKTNVAYLLFIDFPKLHDVVVVPLLLHTRPIV